MANYAKVENNIVTKVIVAEASFFDTFVDDSPGNWIEIEKGSVGFTYDQANSVFIAPKPYPSWTLDASFDWQSPTAMPDDDKKYTWNEDTQAWDEYLKE